jgi:uncharacterized protein YjiS (DUF1127 family)
MTISRILGRVARPLAGWRQRQMAYDELTALDEHMLADIGICRGDIPGIVSGVVAPEDHLGASRRANDNIPTIAA